MNPTTSAETLSPAQIAPSRTRALRLAVLQRVCPAYRVGLFRALSASAAIDMRLFIGADLPNSKVKSAQDLGGVRVTRMPTRFLRLGSRVMPWHRGLIQALHEFCPDVILCEGESHFLGYVQAILYRLRFDRRVALMHWCFTALPGEPDGRRDIAAIVKRLFRPSFDAFVSYSSYSKQRLMATGQAGEKIFVATNVGDVERFLRLSRQLPDSKSDARRRLGLPERFTVLYAGTLDAVKRPEVLLELAHRLEPRDYNFVLLGGGGMLDLVRHRISDERLDNVFAPGRATNELISYFRAADVLLVPGRGGIVMSEALAAGVPAIVHQADGTEYDLVVPGHTGIILASGSIDAFADALESLRRNPALVRSMAANGVRLVSERFNQRAMVDAIGHAALYAQAVRAGNRV